MKSRFIFFLLLIIILLPNKTLAKKNLFNESNIIIEKLKLNSVFNEFGPCVVNSELYFSALNSKKKFKKNEVHFFNLFSLPLNEAEIDGQKAYPENELISNFHDGPISYCETTEELFLTRSDSSHVETKRGIVSKTYIRLAIVIYQKDGIHWKYKGEFPYNNTNYSVGHPAINITGDTLIFVSDKKGGYGKTDLYYSVRKDSLWQAPINLGPLINTKKEELTPFTNLDGTLFFASSGHGGKGGLDLFQTIRRSNQYLQPKNLGAVFNTKSDDFGLTIHPNQQLAYLVSNRESKKGYDNIYQIKTENYRIKTLPLDSAYLLINTLETKVNNRLNNTISVLKAKEAIANNVQCSAHFEILDNNHIPSLRITYGYTLSTDTLRLGLNTYNIGKYKPIESNIVMALLAAIKKDIDQQLNRFFPVSKRIDISILNTNDIFPFNEENQYKGEFGDIVQATCQLNDTFKDFVIENQTQISSEELALLRIYGIRNFLITNCDPLKKTKNKFEYKIIMGDQIRKTPRWVAIQFTIQNAFGNF